jgi:LysM repeat protein
LAVVLILPLALTGCYRSIGGRMEPTPSSGVALVAQQNTPLPQPTFTPMEVQPTLEQIAQEPTLTPFPTLAPPSDTPQPTATWTRVPIDGQGGAAATNTPVIVAIAPSFTPRPLSTTTPLPTAIPTLPPQATSTTTPVPTSTPLPPPATNTPLAVAVIPTFPPTNTQPPVILPSATFTSVPYLTLPPSPTYTPFMPPGPAMSQGQGGALLPTFTPSGGGEAVQLGERPTETQAAPVAVAAVPTLTPQAVAQFPTATLSEFQITATKIVYDATATAAAALGIQLPTFTPIPGQVIYATPLPPNVIVITATPMGQAGICGQYTIQVNDTLYRIAARYGVTVQQIAQVNNITNPDLIKMGATLQIPCPVAATLTPIPVQPQPVNTTGQGGFTASNVYVVQSGDNIYQISLRFGVTMSELMAVNGMDSTSSQMIYVGQELVIPPSAIVPTLTPIPGQIIATPIYIIVTNTPGFSG